MSATKIVSMSSRTTIRDPERAANFDSINNLYQCRGPSEILK